MIIKMFREIIITLLLIVAIIVSLIALFYDYIPSNVIIPEAKTYQTSEEISSELAQTTDDEIVVVTYTIDSDDLNLYEDIESYVAGKSNPFSSYETTESTDDDVEADSNNTTSSNSSSSSSESEYSQNSGTK